MSLHNELRQLEDQGIDLVEILGQDAYLQNPAHLQAILERLVHRGQNLYAELLHFLTHRRFSPSQAESLWNAILENKREMEDKLGRAVRFRVAAADYLHGRTDLLKGLRLIARPEFDALLGFVNVDEVTTVYNRRYFNETLVAEMHRARRYGKPLSLLVIDLDDFKEINDRYGHIEGDAALRHTGRLLRESTRENDIVCRYGGDEFAVLLPETTASEAFSLADRVRKALGRLVLRPRRAAATGNGETAPTDEEPRLHLSATIGGATYPTDCDETEELLQIADRRCLEAKRLGKDQIRMGGETGAVL